MALGGGPLAIGLLNALDNLLSALYSFPGGYLSDRIGAKRSMLVFNLVSMAGYAVVILVPTWQAVLVGAVLFISWSAISLPASLGLMYQVLPQHKRTMGVTMHSLVRRCFPWLWGRFWVGFLSVFGGNVTACVLPLWQPWFWQSWPWFCNNISSSDDHPRGPSGNDSGPLTPEKNPWKLWHRMTPAMKRLLLPDILVRFCEQIPYAFVVVWCMKVITSPVSAIQFGLLTSIEMATAVLVYIPVAHLADRSTKKPFVVITFGFFTLFPLILMFSQSFEWLVLAFIIRGLKEFGKPTRKSLIMDLAPEHCRAAMFGLYYLVRDLFVSVAALGGAFLWEISPETNFIVAFAFGVMGTMGFAVFGHNIRQPENPPHTSNLLE